jgi:circadian clock protein KaiB
MTIAPWYELTLFVSGASEHSARAITDAKRLCDDHLAGHFELEVVDVYKNPAAALTDRVVAAPTLIKRLPAPARRLTGDLSQTAHVLLALGLPPS